MEAMLTILFAVCVCKCAVSLSSPVKWLATWAGTAGYTHSKQAVAGIKWPLRLPWIPLSKCRRMTRTSVQFLFPVMSEEWKWEHSNVSLNWNGWQSLWPGKIKGLAGKPLASSFVTSWPTAGGQREKKRLGLGVSLSPSSTGLRPHISLYLSTATLSHHWKPRLENHAYVTQRPFQNSPPLIYIS